MKKLGRVITGIRQKLTVLLLSVGLIPTIALGIATFFILDNALRSITTNQLQGTAIRQEQRISSLIQTKQEETTQLANQFDFQVALAQYLDDSDSIGRERLSAIIEDSRVESGNVQNIYLTDLSSTVITSTADNFDGFQLSGVAFSVSDNEQTNISIAKDPFNNTDRLYITTRVDVNRQDVAYLVLEFSVNDIVAIVQDYSSLGRTGETIIGSADNSISLFPLRFDANAALSTRLPILTGFKATTAYTGADYRGQEVVAIARPVRFTDWIVVTKIDTSEAFSSVRQFQGIVFAITLASVVIIIAVSYIISRRVTQPVERMAHVAKQIGAGNLSVRTNLERDDEIGVLGQSIDTMSHSLGRFVHSLESERNRLSIIVNNATESIFAIDKDERIVQVNKAATELTHLDPSKMTGRRLQEIFTWRRGPSEVKVDYLANKNQSYSDLEFKDSKGSLHYTILTAVKVRGSKEAHIQAIVTINDVTKQRELENMKLDFVSMAAHELRTPLTSLRSYLDLVRYKFRGKLNPEIDKSLEQALRSSAELGSLINRLLDVSRIESGTLSLSLEKIDLAKDVVLPAIKNITSNAAEKHIKLERHGLDKDCFMFADKIAMREVIDNLIANAIKYTDSGGSVTVAIKKHGKTYRTSVTDTGRGIPESSIPNLFTKFYRVHGGLESGSLGTGLGLFISKSILERHKGSIKVASKEGVGSMFTFTMPEYSPEQEQQVSKNISRRHHGWTTKNITR